jgi:capsular exopolysaccharide synthesis family protein
MAQAGHRVVLIDSDLRRPMLHRYFDLANFNGLTNALLQLELAGGSAVTARQIEAVLQPTPVDGLRLLTSGPLPPNPSELLGSAKMRQLLGALATTHDYVILDSPPVLAVTDAVVLATQVDAVLFVVDSGATRQGAYHQGIERLVKVGAHLVGVALNRLSRKSDGYYYYYHYDYRYSGSDADGKGRSNGHGGSSNGHGTEATPLRPESKRSLLQRRR